MSLVITGYVMLQNVQAVATKEYRYLNVEGHMIGANCLYLDSEKHGPVVVNPSFEAFPHAKNVSNIEFQPYFIRCEGLRQSMEVGQTIAFVA